MLATSILTADPENTAASGSATDEHFARLRQSFTQAQQVFNVTHAQQLTLLQDCQMVRTQSERLARDLWATQRLCIATLYQVNVLVRLYPGLFPPEESSALALLPLRPNGRICAETDPYPCSG